MAGWLVNDAKAGEGYLFKNRNLCASYGVTPCIVNSIVVFKLQIRIFLHFGRMGLQMWLIADYVMPNKRPVSSLVSMHVFQTK